MTTRAEYYRGAEGQVSVSVREAKLVVGRFLAAAGMPMGAVAPIRDVVIDAQAIGLDALAHLNSRFDMLRAFRGLQWSVDDRGVVSVDGCGASALVAAPDVLDLTVVAAHRSEVAVVDVHDVLEPRFLAALTASAYLQRVQMSVHLPSGEVWVARGRAWEPASRDDDGRPLRNGVTRLVAWAPDDEGGYAPDDRIESATLMRALRDGFQVDADLWWSLWDHANRALSPDSPLSRTHAGASVYDDSGQLLGELGEEWDDGYGPGATAPGDDTAADVRPDAIPAEIGKYRDDRKHRQ